MKYQKFSYILPSAMLSILAIANALAVTPQASADDDINPIDDTITITIDSACTMG